MYTISYPSGAVRKDGVEVLPGPGMDEYVEWLEAGNGPQVVEEALPPRRITVSAWQIRKAVNQMGMRAQVEAAVSSTIDQNIIDGWQHAGEFESDNAFVLSMCEAIGVTIEQMRAVFELAEGM